VSVALQVILSNPARRLYERLGFTVVGQSNTHYHMRWSHQVSPVAGGETGDQIDQKD